MHRFEAWMLTLKEEIELLVAKRKIFRKILRLTHRKDARWRIRKVQELKDTVSEPNIIKEINQVRETPLVQTFRNDASYRAVKRVWRVVVY